MHLELSDDEAAALVQEFHIIAENDRYPLSSRIRTLRAILAKLRPAPVPEPLPPPKVYVDEQLMAEHNARLGEPQVDISYE